MRIIDARLANEDRLVDIPISNGRFSDISPSPSVRDEAEPGPPTERTIAAGGRLVTPQFVDAHLHLDYANTAGQPRHNESGTLFEGIQIWGRDLGARQSGQRPQPRQACPDGRGP